MSGDVAAIDPGSEIRLGVETTLRGSIGRLANGRVLVIDYFASRRCSVVVGDLTTAFEDAPPGTEHVELEKIEGVSVFVASGLLDVLADAGPRLRLGGPPFARHIAIDLDRPERWIDFLEGGRGARRKAPIRRAPTPAAAPSSSVMGRRAR